MEPTAMELGSDDRFAETKPVEPMELDPDHRQMEPMELRADPTTHVIQRQPGFRQIQLEQISRRVQLHVQSKLMRAPIYMYLSPKQIWNVTYSYILFSSVDLFLYLTKD